jgi:hypothetical protein
MVVDALDLCYTKSHVNTFVIVSGDSDFSPLVSKLRENAKRVIGVGVKQSTSDLLVANCDEFIFYDDLVREQRRAAAKRDERKAQPQSRRPSDEGNRKREEMEARKLQALEMVVETFDALVSERGDTGKIWASLLKDTLKRRRPDFSETYYGFRTFGNLLEEAQTRGLFEFGRDEKSGTYVFRGANAQVELPVVEAVAEPAVAPDIEPQQAAAEPADAIDELGAETQGEQPSEAPAPASGRESRRRGGRNRKGRDAQAAAPVQETVQEAAPSSEDAAMATWPAPTPDLAEAPEPVAAAAEETDAPAAAVDTPAPAKERRRAPRKTSARKAAAAAAEAPQVADTGTAVTPDTAAADDGAVALDAQAAVAGADQAAAPADTVAVEGDGEGQAEGQASKQARKKSARPSHKAPSRKPAARAPRRPAKPKTPPENG